MRLPRTLRLLSLLALLLPTHATACIVFSKNGLLGINHEDAVIIWDSATSTEHFIRSATLNSKARDAGFLVPTPTTPELAVADSRIFDLANRYIPPGKRLIEALTNSTDGLGAAAAGSAAPRVIAEQDIGDYHAVVLDASDTNGLGDWLKANGYPWSDALAKWLDPYVTAKWKITAFKLRASKSGTIGTNAIRMSFKIDRPFFPYSEPAAASKLGGDNRVLNLAFLGDHGVIGKLAHGIRWPARVEYAGSSTPPDSAHLDKNDWLKYAGLADIGLKLPPQLTYYSDTSNPRPGNSDLYFYPKPDPAHAR